MSRVHGWSTLALAGLTAILLSSCAKDPKPQPSPPGPVTPTPGGVPVSIHISERDEVVKGGEVGFRIGLDDFAGFPHQIVTLEFDQPDAVEPSGHPPTVLVEGGEMHAKYTITISPLAASNVLTITARGNTSDPGVKAKVRIIDSSK